MRPGIDPKVDYAFKKVFGSESNRDVLVDLLNAVLQFGPGREVVEVEILNPFNEKEFADDKLSVVDLKGRDARGRLVAIEMQMTARSDHRQRTLYYVSRLYSQQIVEGQDYRDLPPAFLISFVNSAVLSSTPEYHTRFAMHDRSRDVTFTDDLVIHMVELPKVAAKSDESDRHLRQWCEFLMNASHLDTDALPESMSNPAIRKAMETLREISENERERMQYESRRQKLLDDGSLAAGYAKRDRYYAEKDVEIAQKEEENRRKEEENRRKEEENRRKEEENRRKEEENRRGEEENRNVRLAMAKRIETLAAQFQRLADATENPDTKADFLRQRDAQLQEAETITKALRDNS